MTEVRSKRRVIPLVFIVKISSLPPRRPLPHSQAGLQCLLNYSTWRYQEHHGKGTQEILGTPTRRLVKKLRGSCYGCKRFRAKAYQAPPAGNLPKSSTEGSRLFQEIGIDFAGPICYTPKAKHLWPCSIAASPEPFILTCWSPWKRPSSVFSLESVEWFSHTWPGQDNDICLLWKQTASKYHQLTTVPWAWNCYQLKLILCRDNLPIDAKQTVSQNWAKCTNVKYSDCYGFWKRQEKKYDPKGSNTVEMWFFSGHFTVKTNDTNQITVMTQDP